MRSPYQNFNTKMKSPTWSVGIIEPEGILNGSTAVTRMANANPRMTINVLKKATISPHALVGDPP
jgi:hypothetical protein